MKVGIVGSGVAGLTCAYRLSQKKIETINIEREPFIGGRLFYNIGAITGEDVYPRTHSLIKDLGIEVLVTPLAPSELAVVGGKKVIGAETAPEMLKQLSKEDLDYYQEFMKTLATLDFDGGTGEIEKLRDISLEEYLKDCPDSIKHFFVSAIMNFVFESDYSKMAADYGLFVLKHGFDVFAGKGYIFEESLIPLGNVLEEKVRQAGGKIENDSLVEEITEEGGEFRIKYDQKKKEKDIVVDRIVLTTPLPVAKKIFPALEITSDIFYKDIKCFLVKGELKENRKLFVGVREQDVSNMDIISTGLPFEHLVIPFDPGKEIDFDVWYNSYSVIDEKIVPNGMSVRPPKARMPELTTNIKGAYLCGDFYHYPMIEASVNSANQVVEMISSY